MHINKSYIYIYNYIIYKWLDNVHGKQEVYGILFDTI